MRQVKLSTCYGFEIESELSFNYLRGGGGQSLSVAESDEEVEEPAVPPLVEWKPHEARQLHGKLFQQDGIYRLWFKRFGWFSIDPHARRITVPPFEDTARLEARLWGTAIALCFGARGDIDLHAASVEIDGGALLFAAPGRFGKTTLAATFLRRGFRLLSEDRSCCHPGADPVVYPGPATLRLRRDVYEAMDFPGTYLTTEDPDRVHLAIDEELRGDSSPLPIRGIVLLRRTEGEMRLERAKSVDSLRDIWSLGLNLPTDKHRTQAFGDIAALSSRVPVWNLYRRLEFQNLNAVVDKIIHACTG